MEIKKSPKADLEGKKTSNLLIGAIMVLAVLFVGFEWSERDKKVTTDSGIQEVVFEEEIIPITEQEQPKQAPPPPEAPKVEEVLEIMENDSEVEESTIQASDDTQAAVEVKYTPVEVEEEEVEEQQIFQVVEEMPEFPGGLSECMKFLGKNTSLHLIILHFQMFPVGISSKHTRPLVNAFGPPPPEFVQQGTFTIKMFSILNGLKKPSHRWVGKGRDIILTAVPRCSLPSSTRLSRLPPSIVTI